MRYLLLAILALSLTAQAQTVTTTQSISWTWGNPNLTYPVCSATLTTWCGKGQTLWNTTVAATPVVVDSTITPTAVAATEPAPVRTTGSGAYTYRLDYNYLDGAGAPQFVSSDVFTVVVSAPPAPPKMPTNFSGTVVTTTTQTTAGVKK